MKESLAQNQPEQDEKDGRLIQNVIGSMAIVGRLPDQIIEEALTRSREAPVKVTRVIETMRSFTHR